MAKCASSMRRIRIRRSTSIGTTIRRGRARVWTRRCTVSSSSLCVFFCTHFLPVLLLFLTSVCPLACSHVSLADDATAPIPRPPRRSQRGQVLSVRHPRRVLLGRLDRARLVPSQHPRPRSRHCRQASQEGGRVASDRSGRGGRWSGWRVCLGRARERRASDRVASGRRQSDREWSPLTRFVSLSPTLLHYKALPES